MAPDRPRLGAEAARLSAERLRHPGSVQPSPYVLQPAEDVSAEDERVRCILGESVEGNIGEVNPFVGELIELWNRDLGRTLQSGEIAVIGGWIPFEVAPIADLVLDQIITSSSRVGRDLGDFIEGRYGRAQNVKKRESEFMSLGGLQESKSPNRIQYGPKL